jgi:hypothetical protein
VSLAAARAATRVLPRTERGTGSRWWICAGLLALVGSLPPEVVFVLLLLALALRLCELGFTLALPPARLWAGPFACLALGALQLWRWPVRDVARDVWFLSGPAVLALYGWTLIRRPADLHALLRALVLGATIWSVLHLARAAQSLDLLSVGRVEFRQATGAGSLLPVVALFVLVGARVFGAAPVIRGRLAAWTCGGVCALAQVASFSRTWWGACALLVLAGLAARLGAARVVWGGRCSSRRCSRSARSARSGGRGPSACARSPSRPPPRCSRPRTR